MNDIERSYVLSGLIGLTGPMWAPMLASSPMAVGAVTGAVAGAGGRVLAGDLKNSPQGQYYWQRIAWYGATGAAAGAVGMMMLGGSTAAGAYTPNLVLGATSAAAGYLTSMYQSSLPV